MDLLLQKELLIANGLSETEISQLEKFVWKDSLFKNSNRIKEDSASSHFRKNNNLVYIFSKPLYIRDNSIALTSFVVMCGNNCGQNEVAFYKKEKGKWIKWVVISQGTL